MIGTLCLVFGALAILSRNSTTWLLGVVVSMLVVLLSILGAVVGILGLGPSLISLYLMGIIGGGIVLVVLFTCAVRRAFGR